MPVWRASNPQWTVNMNYAVTTATLQLDGEVARLSAAAVCTATDSGVVVAAGCGTLSTDCG